jgi:hypothetical protein
MVQFDCHPEQACFAQRRIWASRAQNRAFGSPPFVKLHHYHLPQSFPQYEYQGL